MPQCTAAICLAQLEIIEEQVAHRDRMARLLSRLIAEIPGVRPLPIPDYQDVYSCWMFGISLEDGAFRCSTEEFAAEVAAEGVTGAGMGEYYLMPAALPFLQENAAGGVYPYSMPPASRRYGYDADSCPTARDFLTRFIRWSSFCEKYQEQDCELAAGMIGRVAERNRL